MRVRPVTIDGDIAIVPLSRGLFALVDASDIGLVSGRNWHVTGVGCRTYAASWSSGTRSERKLELMHRVIFGEAAAFVDHIDLDRFNNRRANLREATCAENNRNRGLQSNNSSGFKGVYWHKLEKKWRAVATFNGTKFQLGSFATAEEAGRCFRDWASKLHGEFWREA